MPCYRTSAAKIPASVYRRGQVSLTDEMVNWQAKGDRLPPETEWEKAARGGLDGKQYPTGDQLTEKDANFKAHKESADWVTVKAFAPNGYGLYGRAGNVWEICWDFYSKPVGADAAAPNTARQNRVSRGGGCVDRALECRVFHRGSFSPLQATAAGGSGGFAVRATRRKAAASCLT